jgi:hypothetical protein
MAKQEWDPSIVTSGHLQKLVKQGFITAVELVAYRVPEDPAFLAHMFMVSTIDATFVSCGLSHMTPKIL